MTKHDLPVATGLPSAACQACHRSTKCCGAPGGPSSSSPCATTAKRPPQSPTATTPEFKQSRPQV